MQKRRANRRRPTTGRLGVLGLIAALLLTLLPLVSARTASAAGIDTSNRQAVADAYNGVYLPASNAPRTWTGSVDGCRPGTFDAQGQAATLTAINFYRSLVGLDAVRFDQTLSAKSQQSALMMLANDSLSHDPPKSWKCWTEGGAEAAGKGNIAIGWLSGGAAGVGAIDLYMDDRGTYNTPVGHRRWVLRPATAVMGSGSVSTQGVGSANTLWVILGGDRDPGTYADPEWVSWPSPGWFPSQLEPAGRWSLSASGRGWDFSQAKVRVTNAAGTALALTQYPPAWGYANDTLVWDLAQPLPAVEGKKQATYTVSVSGMKNPQGRTVSHSYQVTLFDPTAPQHTFVDVPPGTTFFDEIEWMARQRISTGWPRPDGGAEYRPVTPVKRDAMAAFLYRYAGSPQVTLPARSPFADITPTTQFYKEMVWMYQAGISTGWIEQGRRLYKPLADINRDAMAAFLFRLQGEKNYRAPARSPFVDVTPTNQFFTEIAWMHERGISTGYLEGGRRLYKPLGQTNRDAMAAFLFRADGLGGTSGTSDTSGEAEQPEGRTRLGEAPVAP